MIQLTNQIAVVGDLHLGNQPYNDIWQKIPLEYAEWLKSNLVKHNIKTIIFLGDIFNNREELSVLTLHLPMNFSKY
jgi:metallophosphoesterase superfamily enzyme